MVTCMPREQLDISPKISHYVTCTVRKNMIVLHDINMYTDFNSGVWSFESPGHREVVCFPELAIKTGYGVM